MCGLGTQYWEEVEREKFIDWEKLRVYSLGASLRATVGFCVEKCMARVGVMSSS